MYSCDAMMKFQHHYSSAVSRDPSKIIIICWIGTQVYFFFFFCYYWKLTISCWDWPIRIKYSRETFNNGGYS